MHLPQPASHQTVRTAQRSAAGSADYLRHRSGLSATDQSQTGIRDHRRVVCPTGQQVHQGGADVRGAGKATWLDIYVFYVLIFLIYI